MKKLLAAIALVLAFCLPVFALAACSEGDTIVGEQLQGEEQWKQAFTDTIAARKNNCTVKMDSKMLGDLHGLDFHMTMSVKCDYENHVLCYEAQDNYYKAVGTEYIELSDKEIIHYTRNVQGNYDNDEKTDSGWKISKTEYQTKELAAEKFADIADDYLERGGSSRSSIQGVIESDLSQSSSLIELKYALTEVGEKKDLSELFTAFTYDSATNKYSASLYAPTWEYLPVVISLTFSDGKLAKCEADFTIEDDGSQHEICNIEYGYTANITIPEEAKNGTVSDN